MRVTKAVREYVRKVVLAKVAGKLEAAGNAKDAVLKDRDDKVAAAKALAEKMLQRFQKEYAAEAAKLGLTWIPDTYDYQGNMITRNGNTAFSVGVCSDDFEETISSGANAYGYASAKSKACRRVADVLNGPDRIRQAANDAADKLLFELELGKVEKKELDDTLKGLEVKL